MSTLLRRCRPLLGTLVEIRVQGLRQLDALSALTAAFDEIAAVHARMSFHTGDSDITRLHRAPVGACVTVDARTFEVLRHASDFARLSEGAFDITIAAQLVRSGALPRPPSPFEPDTCARWHDIELLPPHRVRLRRPLWLDVGGIAKGYAVDRAIEVLQRHGATQACVNAGGDLRVIGPRAEPVFLRRGDAHVAECAELELQDAAIATSAPSTAMPAHFHRAGGDRVAAGATVSVIAPRCVLADALTKIVLSAGPDIAARALAACAAQAYVHRDVSGWRALEHAA